MRFCMSDGLITRDWQEVDEGIKYEGAKLCLLQIIGTQTCAQSSRRKILGVRGE